MPERSNRHRIQSGIAALTLLLIPLATAYGQTAKLLDDAPGGRLTRPAAPVYDVVALRVEFQPDDSRFSTGDGVFGGSMFADLDPRIDPFPHDQAYFQAHLDFLSNYVERVSRGQTVVRTHLVPEVVRVSGKMGDYSPIGPASDSPAERQKLLNLVREAWQLADQQSAFDASALNPQRTAFIIFHAGTGRDIELTGTTLDRTPEDLPSLYFDATSLSDSNPLIFKRLVVTNSAIIPETESKRGVDPITDEPFLLELSINGLVAASFFNYLGVPDLFDTSTGTSAIGPYGLMDPLGIFAYGGLLPPEPSAWTKLYLGWVIPTEVGGPDPQEVQLQVGLDQALVPVSETEYFLVEVRHRDPDGDGLNLSVLRDGQLVTLQFDADADDFTSTNQSGFDGVLIDSDDFDWALPGGIDDTQTLRNGGILIWHVDERVISDGLATNAVNVNASYRGVDLEEADSAQDLGFPSGNIFAPDFDRGTPFDYYFEGNPVTSITATGQVTLYENRFGPDTYPNSNSNGGGPTLIVLDEFGPQATTMGFRYSRAQGNAQPIDFPASYALATSFGQGASVTMRTDPSGSENDDLLLFSGPESGTLWVAPVQGGSLARFDGVLGAPVVDDSPASGFAYLIRDDVDEVSFTRFNPFGPAFRVPFPAEVRLAVPSTPLVGIRVGAQIEYYTGFDLGDTGYLVRITPDDQAELVQSPVGGMKSLASGPDGDLVIVGESRAVLWKNGLTDVEWVFDTPLGQVGQAVVGRDAIGLTVAIPSVDQGRLTILSGNERMVDVAVGSALSGLPVLADTDADGALEVIVTSGARLLAYSREGAVAAGFPKRLPSGAAAQPLVVGGADDEEGVIVLVPSLDGYIHAVSVGGATIPSGFPLPVGGQSVVTPLISKGRVFTASPTGTVTGWSVQGLSEPVWPQLFGATLNGSVLDVGDSPTPDASSGDLIVAEETYNWPNPVREGATRLRFAAREPCSVDIEIVDLAGKRVHSFETEVATPHVPIEFEWRPDVESGVYFARVSARTASGRHDAKLYSIAVIR